nr:uncharacterized protein LOC122271996 [Parasteatoda tepidariorum]
MPQKTRPKDYIALIRPTNSDTTSEQTKSDILSSLDPNKLKIGVKRLAKIRDGGSLIRTNTERELKILEQEFRGNNLMEKYGIARPKLINPSIIVFGVDGDIGKEELTEALINQNIIEQEDIDVKFPLRAGKDKNNWVVEIQLLAFNKIMNIGKLNIRWSRYFYREHLRVRQCFKCSQLGHLARDCANEQICRKCSQTSHQDKECQNLKLCTNCDIANRKFKAIHDINHSPFDIDCPQLKRARDQQIKRINYGH